MIFFVLRFSINSIPPFLFCAFVTISVEFLRKDHSQSSSPWGDCHRRWRKTAGRICPPRGADGLELLRRYYRRCHNRLHYSNGPPTTTIRRLRKKMNGDWLNVECSGLFRWWRYISAGCICLCCSLLRLQLRSHCRLLLEAEAVAAGPMTTAFRLRFGPAMSESSRPPRPNPAILDNSSWR